MLNFILLFLIMVMPSPFSQADNIDESLFEYFPEGYYSSIAYTDMKFVDQMVTLVGDVMPQYSRDAYLEVLPPGFCKSAEKVLFPLYGDNLEVVFVVSHKDPLSALKTSLKKKEAVLTDQKVLGKNVFQFITKPNRIGKRDTIYFILFETNTILGSTNPELIVKMVETKEGQHLNIFAGRYYKEFRKMFPELGGVVLAHFQEEDIVEAIEKERQKGKMTEKEYDSWRTNYFLASKYEIYSQKIVDGVFQTGLTTYFFTEDGARNLFRSYENRKDDGITSYTLKDKTIIIREVYTKEALKKTKEERLKWEAEARRKEARKRVKDPR